MPILTPDHKLFKNEKFGSLSHPDGERRSIVLLGNMEHVPMFQYDKKEKIANKQVEQDDSQCSAPTSDRKK